MLTGEENQYDTWRNNIQDGQRRPLTLVEVRGWSQLLAFIYSLKAYQGGGQLILIPEVVYFLKNFTTASLYYFAYFSDIDCDDFVFIHLHSQFNFSCIILEIIQ